MDVVYSLGRSSKPTQRTSIILTWHGKGSFPRTFEELKGRVSLVAEKGLGSWGWRDRAPHQTVFINEVLKRPLQKPLVIAGVTVQVNSFEASVTGDHEASITAVCSAADEQGEATVTPFEFKVSDSKTSDQNGSFTVFKDTEKKIQEVIHERLHTVVCARKVGHVCLQYMQQDKGERGHPISRKKRSRRAPQEGAQPALLVTQVKCEACTKKKAGMIATGWKHLTGTTAKVDSKLKGNHVAITCEYLGVVSGV